MEALRGHRPRRTDGSPEDHFAAARAAMVERQLRARGIHDERVLAAMGTVPRERFVPADLLSAAYADGALPTMSGQTISQPYIVALMTELLAPEPGDRVLEVGTGTGYQAAILAAMGCPVTGYEWLPELAHGARARLTELGFGDLVEVRVGDGSIGDPDGAPWTRIIVAAAAPDVPDALTRQLAEGGRLVVPVGGRWEQELTLVVRDGDRLRTSRHGGCIFVPLVGEAGYKGRG